MNRVFDFIVLGEMLCSFLAVASRYEEEPPSEPFCQFRRFVVVINSMTPHERRYPQTILLEPSRLDRIALGAGVDRNSVFQLIQHLDWTRKLVGNTVRLALLPAPSVCEKVHQAMIAGKCPWCGIDIFRDGV